MQKANKQFHSRFTNHSLSATAFYQKYWQIPDDAIPKDDPTTPQRVSLLLDMLNKIGRDKKVLDAGCGEGFFANAIRKTGCKVVGMDISHNAITQARRLYSDIEFVCNPLDSRWPFENGSFDVVFSTEVIEHVLDSHEMLSEMNRVLKTGGWLILTTPYHGLIKNILIVMFGFEGHFCNIEGGHIRFFTNKLLKKLLNKYGFETRVLRYIGRIPVIARSVFIAAQKV